MKRYFAWLMAAGLVACTVSLTACEWGSGGDTGFNTSEGAGAQVNFSGVYKGMLAGGVIDQTSGGPIGQLVIQQAGNAVEVTDDHGSVYRGTVGSPGAVSEAVSGTYPSGAQLVQAQINFTGHDNVADKTINFAGVIHVVAVTDIQGTKTEDVATTDDSSDSSTSDETSGNNVVTTQTTQNNGVNTIITKTTVFPDGTTKVETTTIDDKTNQVIDDKVTTTYDNKNSTASTSKNTVTTTTTTEYNITEANSQYRMQGTWVEEGGKVANLDAISSGTAGVITTTSSSSSTTQ